MTRFLALFEAGRFGDWLKSIVRGQISRLAAKPQPAKKMSLREMCDALQAKYAKDEKP